MVTTVLLLIIISGTIPALKAQENVRSQVGPSLTLLNTYDFIYGRLGLFPYSFGVRYDAINSQDADSNWGRENGNIYQFDFRYQSELVNIDEDLSALTKDLLIGLGIGKNIFYIRNAGMSFNIDGFAGINYLYDRYIPFSSIGFPTRNHFLELSSMIDMNMRIRINPTSAMHISFPVPLLDVRYERFKNENPNLPISRRSSTKNTIALLDLNTKFVARFGITLLLK